jgi:N-acetyl-anhydromuramyl-L-alanine amidase AmpD
MRNTLLHLTLFTLLLNTVACTPSRSSEPFPSAFHHILICNQPIPIDAPVILWTDPAGYNAYSLHPRFARPGSDQPGRPRYNARPGNPDTIPQLAAAVDQFVIHYDAAGTSRECFRILHDVRNLSVHFLLDLDGTIYQTLDVKERAWHATIANDRSIGIEIAHIGAYPPTATGDPPPPLDRWYAREDDAWRITLPPHAGDGGLRTPTFIARPASSAPITGTINNRELIQHDFTPQQYDSLAKLLTALNAALPRIELDAPRDAHGRILARTLTAEEFAGFRGVLGHYHVQLNKSDPGPAFDWDRVLRQARAGPATPP